MNQYDLALIEKYLESSLTPEEQREFNYRMKNTPAFAKEVQEYEVMFDSFQVYANRTQLKNKLDTFHEEIEQDKAKLEVIHHIHQKEKVRVLWKKYASMIGIAACVALIAVVIGNVLTLDNVRSLEEQQSSYYKALRRDINEVKKEQKEIAKKQQKKEKKNTSPVKQYGATAFVISSEGYLVTNYHVVKNADSIHLETKRAELLRLKAKTVFTNKAKDLAILKVVDPNFIGFAELPYMLRCEEADLGEDVYTLAYPRQDMVYGEGSISAHSGYQGDKSTYQISVPVNPGNSGGPLLDEHGNLIGIVSGKHTNMDGAAFAVKAKYVKAAVDSMITKNQEQPIFLPKRNFIRYLKRPEQIKKLQDFVFVVKAYNSKD